MAFGLQVSDDALDGRAAAQFELDNTEDAAHEPTTGSPAVVGDD